VALSVGLAVDELVGVDVRVGVAAGEGGGDRVGLVGCALFVSAIDVLALQPASKPSRHTNRLRSIHRILSIE
jgi:hypothetical protein